MSRLIRESLIPLTGLGLAINESLRPGEARYSLLILYAGMMGLSVFRTDTMGGLIEKMRNGNGNGHRKTDDDQTAKAVRVRWRFA